MYVCKTNIHNRIVNLFLDGIDFHCFFVIFLWNANSWKQILKIKLTYTKIQSICDS